MSRGVVLCTYEVGTGAQMAEQTRLELRIDAELLEAVKAKAKAEDLTVSQLVRRLLRAYLADNPPEPKPGLAG
jgi:predicted DNA binding CopG/RHH family protein